MLKTWDVFDTLIARRCIFPHGIFQIMEQRFRMPGFTKARMLAERKIISEKLNLIRRGLNYSLDDIYDEIEKITNLDNKTCQMLKNLELEVELEQAIPITENILQVKSGDILISDMYLPADFLRKMLEKCGLLVPVEVIVTAGGKSSGRIWRQLAAQNKFLFHIGDNELSDVKFSRDAGFDSVITLISQQNEVENFLLQKDFNFAAYLRELRLRNPYQEEIKRLYWKFFTWNAAILIILVQLIDDLQKKGGFEYLGFCGRDTYYLWLLYKKFKQDKKESPPPSDYLYYSRKMVFKSTDEMAKYFTAKINNRKALMIDLGGSGNTFNNLRNKMEQKFSILLCFLSYTKIFDWTQFYGQENFDDSKNRDFYFVTFGNTILEYFNRATHNTPIKLNCVQIDDKIVPEVFFSEVSDTENLYVFETCLQEILKSQVQWYRGEASNAIENIKQLLEFMLKLAEPYAFQNQQKINEAVDIKTNTFKML